MLQRNNSVQDASGIWNPEASSHRCPLQLRLWALRLFNCHCDITAFWSPFSYICNSLLQQIKLPGFRCLPSPWALPRGRAKGRSVGALSWCFCEGAASEATETSLCFPILVQQICTEVYPTSVVIKLSSPEMPGGLIKIRFLVPTPRVSDSVSLEWSWVICISSKFPGVVGKRAQSQNHCLHRQSWEAWGFRSTPLQ